MKIALGADHAGYPLNEQIAAQLAAEGHEVLDFGTHSSESSDYPDFAGKVAQAVQMEKAERGIIVCGSGVGACVAANKFRGIRACLCHDTYSARQGVEHDDMNVLCIGARIVGSALAAELVRAFLSGKFSAEERHQRRLEKVLAFERALSGR